MNPEYAKAVYRRHLTNKVVIRRYTGSGPSRTPADVTCRASVKADNMQSNQLADNVKELTYRAVVLVEDLVAGGFALPMTTADKMVFDGKEMAISFPDRATRTVGETLLAYNVRARG